MKDKYKRTKFWCWGCDGNLVAGGMKCAKCGSANQVSKQKNKTQLNETLKEVFEDSCSSDTST
jgi:hypothetical protein